MSNDILTQIAELEAQIAEFPIGSIGQKQVNGKTYYYHRFREDGKRKEKYIPEGNKTRVYENIELAIKRLKPDAIIYTGATDIERMNKLAIDSHALFYYSPREDSIITLSRDVDFLAATPIIRIKTTPLSGGAIVYKRFVDIILSLIGTIIALPIMIIIFIIQKIIDEDGIVGIMLLVSNLLETVNTAVVTLFRGLHIYSLYVKMIIGGGDADEIARSYGNICGMYYPIKGIILNGMKVDQYDDYIQPDFLATHNEYEFQLIASLNVALILKVGLKAGKTFLINLIKNR